MSIVYFKKTIEIIPCKIPVKGQKIRSLELRADFSVFDAYASKSSATLRSASTMRIICRPRA